jgi:hypothetical protein
MVIWRSGAMSWGLGLEWFLCHRGNVYFRLVGSCHYVWKIPWLTDEQAEHLFKFLLPTVAAIGEITEFTQVIAEVT